MDNQPFARMLIIAGLLLLAAGLVWYFLGDRLSWLGRLPGDIRIERENFRFYFPITSMIILSLLLSLIIGLVRRWLG